MRVLLEDKLHSLFINQIKNGLEAMQGRCARITKQKVNRMSGHGRILVIDDDENVTKAFAIALEKKGYTVDIARDGREALDKSKSNFYNLALIDIRLPDMEGIQLLSSMREVTPEMVKIIVTGYPSLQNAIQAVNKGADGYIIKPVNIDKLLSTVEEHLKKQQDAMRYSEQKVAEYIETRAREQESKHREF